MKRGRQSATRATWTLPINPRVTARGAAAKDRAEAKARVVAAMVRGPTRVVRLRKVPVRMAAAVRELVDPAAIRTSFRRWNAAADALASPVAVALPTRLPVGRKRIRVPDLEHAAATLASINGSAGWSRSSIRFWPSCVI